MTDSSTTASFPEQGEITAALLRVKAAMPTIEKNVTVPLGGSNSYQTRGMEDILTEAKPLMVDEQIVTYPIHEIERIEHDTTRNGNRETHWTTVFTRSTFVFVCAIDNSRTIVQTIGEGRDSSDKAATKAQVSAHKLAIVQLLELHAGDEPDAERPEAVTEYAQQAPRQQQASGGRQQSSRPRAAAPRAQQQEPKSPPSLRALKGLREELERLGLYQAIKSWAELQQVSLDPATAVEEDVARVLDRAKSQINLLTSAAPAGDEPDEGPTPEDQAIADGSLDDDPGPSEPGE